MAITADERAVANIDMIGKLRPPLQFCSCMLKRILNRAMQAVSL